jgi:hypothetical protein
MPFEWKLAALGELKPLLPNKPLQDTEIRVNLVSARVEQPISLGLEGLAFIVDTGTSVSVEAFNSPGDVDAEGVVGDPPAEPQASRLSPPLVLGQDAWLKYAVRTRAKAQAGASMPFLSAGASGEVSVLVADYHLHALTEKVRDALNQDNENLRLPLIAEHVLKLQPKEALTFQARMNLQASVSLRWADVFTTQLNALSRLLPAGTLLGIQSNVGASVAGSVSVSDDFALTFSREKAGAVVVSIQKGVVRDAKVAASIGVSVGLAETESVMGAALDALVGLPGFAQFEKLVDKLAASELSEKERGVLRKVLDRLGLTEYAADASAIEQAWENLKGKARDALAAMASEKISAGFQYEYRRMAEHQTLMRLELADAQLKKLHSSLLLGRLSYVLSQVDPSALRSYFHQETHTQRQAWGFSLGFAKWQLLRGHTQKKLQRVVQYGSPDHVHGPRRIAYLGVRSYEGGLFQAKGGWSVDFKCDMGQFKPQPTLQDFDFGLYLQVHRTGKLSEDALRQAIDEAIAWHVLDDADEEQVFEQIRAVAAKGDKLEVRLEVKLGDALVRQLVPLTALGQPEAFAKALARAMPWDSSAARSSPEFRQGVYAPLWMAYLQEKAKDWTPQRAAQRAAAWLKQDRIAKGVGGQIAYWEGQGTAQPNTFADVLDKNSRLADLGSQYGGTYIRWQRMVAGMAQLRDALQQGRDPSILEAVFEELEEFWSVSFHLKAFGALLLEQARSTVQGLQAAERTLTVSTPAGEPKAQLVFSASRAG